MWIIRIREVRQFNAVWGGGDRWPIGERNGRPPYRDPRLIRFSEPNPEAVTQHARATQNQNTHVGFPRGDGPAATVAPDCKPGVGFLWGGMAREEVVVGSADDRPSATGAACGHDRRGVPP